MPESVLTTPNRVEFDYKSLAEAFPNVDPGMKPCGFVGLFQIRHPKRFTKGGLELIQETRSTEHYNTQVAKVIALGDLAFKSVKTIPNQTGVIGPERDVLVDWPEGKWFKIGDFVRLPKYGGDRFSVPYMHESEAVDPESGEKYIAQTPDEIIFALFQVKNVMSVITGDPLKIKAFLD